MSRAIQRPLGPEKNPTHLDRWLWLLALCVLLLAFAARVYRIFDVPPSLTGDEAANLTDIARILRGGYLPVYFEANNGREPLFIYLQTPLVALLGPVPYALRLTSALVGIATVALAYRFSCEIFRNWEKQAARWAPLVVAFLLASSFWHLTLSRIGLRAISLPMLMLAAYLLFWRGYASGKNRYYAASGALLGLTLYTYIASRLAPLVLVIFLLGGIFWRQAMPRARGKGLALMGLALAVVAAPLAAYAVEHPLIFWGRVASVSTLDTTAPSTWESFTRTLGMFFVQGNYLDTTFDPGARPVFDWPMGATFLAGLVLSLAVLWVYRRRAPRPAWLISLRPEVCLFCLVWLSVMIVPSIFSYPAPHFLRTVGAIPVAYIFPAMAVGVALLGVSRISSWLWKKLGYLALIVLVLASGANNLWDYARLATSDWYYYELDSDIYEMALYIKERTSSPNVAIFGDTQLMRFGTVRALTSGSAAFSFDSASAVPFPPSETEYLFLSKEAPSRDFGRYLPPGSASFGMNDSRGKETVVGYRTDGGEALEYNRAVPSAPLYWANRPPSEPNQAEDPAIAGQIVLRGFGVAYGQNTDPAQTGELRPGQLFRVILAWEVLQKPSQSYQVSVKAFDGSGKAWAQIDSGAGGGRYTTDKWTPGEWVYDMYDLTLDPAAPSGEYHLEVTAYDVNSLKVFPILSGSGRTLSQHYLLGNLRVER
ncbi:MAG: glycosyltransferase family 39 protein [Dehalococcoidia bacterium]|nr:glycosyltransferase family 39 protein [Dehalococcoidia bacterium]